MNKYDYHYNNNGYKDEEDWFWGEDSKIMIWLMVGLASMVFLLMGAVIFGERIASGMFVLGNNVDFNRYLFTYGFVFLVVLMSKKGWTEKPPVFGLRMFIITMLFLMIGYGATDYLIENWYAYYELKELPYVLGTQQSLMDEYYWNIMKFAVIIYLITITSWAILQAAFTGTNWESTIKLIKHIGITIFFISFAVYTYSVIDKEWLIVDMFDLVLYLIVLVVTSIISFFEVKKIYYSWKERISTNEARIINDYQQRVLDLADRTMVERQNRFGTQERSTGVYNTVIDTSDIDEDIGMTFEIDGSKEDVLLRIPDGSKMIVNITKVPEAKVLDDKKTEIVQELIKGEKDES